MLWATVHNSRLVSLLQHCLAAIHCTLELTENSVAPGGATEVGITDLVQVGVAIIKIKRGATVLWTGYWNASGN